MASQPVGSVSGSLIDWAAGVIGIPAAVVRQQIIAESNGQPGAVSKTGAEGAFQFEPGTWASEGCSGSPFNVNDGAKCYAKLMYQLVQQYHGNIRDALAAYNAGPGNLAGGYGYADGILAAAGQPSGAQASGGTGNSGVGGAASASAATLTSSSTRCLIGGNTFIPCLLDASQARGLIGGMCLLGGGLIFAVGVVVLVAISAERTGIASALPGPVGTVAGQVARRGVSAPRRDAGAPVLERAETRAEVKARRPASGAITE